MKNHEEYFDDFPLYKFHLSSYWYESKDSSIQRLANRIPTHSLLGIHQLNDQTNATWKKDDQQQSTLISEDVNFIKALILNKHELMEVFTQIIMPMRECFQKTIKTLRGISTTIICQLSNDDDTVCSSYYLLHPYLVLLPGVETTFLPVRIQKFIYSSKTKAKMNQSTNVEVCGNYYDNICGIGQEEI
ncbi:unnamed protein product [Adineta steineri]|uniref:Uncharacterized protein n=1 Tax=Adineta steineri TaxID=433720 RepID=A0A819CEQ8_9BILA|nr:unnamed protein product [Adineta steineri]CAF3818059.1 unnamed protein product [Adineta steineri]